MRSLQLRLVPLLALGLLLSAAGTALAEDPLEERMFRLAKKLYCPVCEQLPLDACETQACLDWKDLIRQKLQAGESEEQIVAYFVERYGPQVLASPPRQGFNWLVWAVPGAGLLAGALWLARQLRRWSGRPRVEETPEPPPSRYLEQVEREVYGETPGRPSGTG